MKSNNILERKYELKKGKDDKELALRINTIFSVIFDDYSKLDNEGKDNLRTFIYMYFTKLRPTKCKEKNYKEELEKLLYPEIFIVALSHLYSDDGYIQYSFLLKVYDKIEKELNKNIKNKEKIK